MNCPYHLQEYVLGWKCAMAKLPLALISGQPLPLPSHRKRITDVGPSPGTVMLYEEDLLPLARRRIRNPTGARIIAAAMITYRVV